MERRYIPILGLAFLAGLLIFGSPIPAVPLPPLQAHPLPPSLAGWQNKTDTSDYFAEVKIGSMGVLIWSDFPVTVYIKPDRPVWMTLARKAIADWNVYLPLRESDDPENADISIERAFPPSGVRFNPETGKLDLPRVRSATTQYDIFVNKINNSLSHRMRVIVSPNLNDEASLSALRHEIGHALSIWGHSPQKSDLMYFSQSRDLPSISIRDVNTLKKVYEQPTRLGWATEAR